MRKIALIILAAVCLYVSIPSDVYAQVASASTVPTVRTQGLISDFLNWLSGILSEKKVPEKMEHVNCSTLPLGQGTDCGNSGQVKAQGLFDNIISRTGQDYGTAADSRLPITNDDRSDFQKWLDQTFAFNQGTEKAGNYYQAGTPLGVAAGLLSSNATTSNESEAMVRAEQLKKCANLPMGAGGDDCDTKKLAVYISPTPTYTPTPIPSPTPADAVPPDVPPVDGGNNPGSSVASCPVGNGNCPDIPTQEAGKSGDPNYYKSNNCYWKNFLNAFSGNEVKARAASQICFRESGGDIINLNDHCLPYKPDPLHPGQTVFRPISERTQDYSVGLFQVNLLAHCPGALRNDWSTNRSCTILNQAKLNECYARLTTFNGNVAEMLRISNNGTNWKPWSTAAPTYCGVDNSQMMCVPPLPTSPPQNPPPQNSSYVYYSQKDYRSTPYGAGCTIYSSGCGPTTLAMILSTYLGPNWTPPTVAKTLLSTQSCQTSPSALYGALVREGFKPNYKFVGKRFILGDADKSSIKTDLANGAIILAGADMGWYERGCNCVKYGGHYFWIVDINSAGQIIVLDPWYGAGRPYPIAQNSINSYPVYYKHMIVAYPPGGKL